MTPIVPRFAPLNIENVWLFLKNPEVPNFSLEFFTYSLKLITENCSQREELRVICGTRGVPGTVAPFRAWRGSRDLVAQSPKFHAPALAKFFREHKENTSTAFFARPECAPSANQRACSKTSLDLKVLLDLKR
jgi:hypothetical protein